MIKGDYHIHTLFSDGKNTPEEMVQAAIEAGLDTLGFTDHSYTAFDLSFCMKKEAQEPYRREIARLKEQYKGRLRILCGIEQDYCSGRPEGGYDYVIGSVHYVEGAGRLWSVDDTPQLTREAVEQGFQGDPLAYAEGYFAAVSALFQVTGCGVCGHFDLLQKFCERDPLIDPEHPRYRAAWQKAADRLLSQNILFEINTGAMTRGYRSSPYPDREILDYLKARGARFVYGSDSHAADSLGKEYEGLQPYLPEEYCLI